MSKREMLSALMSKAWTLARRVARVTRASLPYNQHDQIKPRHYLGWAMSEIWSNFKSMGWYLEIVND